jgi:hypothetical protein
MNIFNKMEARINEEWYRNKANKSWSTGFCKTPGRGLFAFDGKNVLIKCKGM